MHLKTFNILKLSEIKELLENLPQELYMQPQGILGSSTVGQHFRHIIEFYQCLQQGAESGTICYDERQRDLTMEINVGFAIHAINDIINFIESIQHDRTLVFSGNYSSIQTQKSAMQTSLFRELAYSLDHTIHHLAIIKIALAASGFSTDDDFGKAPSTIRHQKTCAQ